VTRESLHLRGHMQLNTCQRINFEAFAAALRIRIRISISISTYRGASDRRIVSSEVWTLRTQWLFTSSLHDINSVNSSLTFGHTVKALQRPLKTKEARDRRFTLDTAEIQLWGFRDDVLYSASSEPDQHRIGYGETGVAVIKTNDGRYIAVHRLSSNYLDTSA
jgi:hypothetical protein